MEWLAILSVEALIIFVLCIGLDLFELPAFLKRNPNRRGCPCGCCPSGSVDGEDLLKRLDDKNNVFQQIGSN